MIVRSSLVAVAVVFAGVLHAQQPAAPPVTTAPPSANTARFGNPIVVDSFDSVSQWSATPADGVEISIHPDSGAHGGAMRLDFDFHGHGGYAVVHRAVNLTLPANYEFSFTIRGDAPTNTLELKLIDSTTENVWWSNNTNFVFPREWKTISRKKRQISFAWGPIGGGEMKRVAAIELAITAGSGGKGSVWIDDLALTPLEPDAPYLLTPRITSTAQTYDVDFLKRREFGGLVIDWEPKRRAISYDVQASSNAQTWQTLYSVRRTADSPPPQSVSSAKSSSSGSRDYLYLPESDARYLRIVRKDPGTANGFGIRNLSVEPLAWAPSENDFFMAIAKDAPGGRGSYPKYLSNEQSYWTVVGADRDSVEGLINEEGMIETGRGKFSIEPFLFVDDRLITWNDAKTAVVADPEALPIPQVTWSARDLDLSITTFAAGPPDSSVLYARYRITNSSKKYRKLTLYLALRPFQVNPPWQFLNLAGGVAPIDTITLQGISARVNGEMYVRALSSPSGFGAVTFDEGNIVDWLRTGKLPAPISVTDHTGHASAAFAYSLELGPRATSSPIDIAIPLHGGDLNPAVLLSASRPGAAATTTLLPGMAETAVSAQMEKARADWRAKLGRVSIVLPPSASRYTETMRANLAYILINRDGAAIQPGSRSYSRSWIRDGSLTSTALLRLGHAADVKDFIEWYAPYQYDNGKVPCCVDEHGATPVPENDSHGEFIYLVAEYYRHTGDRALLEKMWPHVASAVAYMDSLRHSRMTEQFKVEPYRAFYGLLPQSISHEGYSAKPMHSYWDDIFALRGFKDAAFIARVLDKPEAASFATMRNGFRQDLYESIRQTLINHHIDFIPGSVELGDLDATSTTIAVSPGGELGRIPGPALQRTFDIYFNSARARANGTRQWDNYTPYELRTVGTFVHLGQRNRAHELLDFFFNDQRPAAWHQWAEVVWHDPNAPKFIGDMPHTWVGSDYIRSFLDMFAYERESDSSLVLGAGLRDAWVEESPGIRVSNLSTHYGPLSYQINAIGKVVTVTIPQGVRIPLGGIVVYSPLDMPILSASVDGIPTAVKGAEIRVRKLPATVTIRYPK